MIKRLLLLLLAAEWILYPVQAAQELIVSAAASLTDAFTELGKGFEQIHPDSKIIFNFAASGALLAQIAQGAPVDALACADQETMDKAEKQDLIAPDTRVNFARNRLVLVVPINSSLAIASLTDLSKPEVKRIALGNPQTVPNGRYARAALLAAKLWEDLTPKFIYVDNVRQSLSYVARSEVDAGFVFATDVAIEKNKVKMVLEEIAVPTPIVYPIAAVSKSHAPQLAQAFIDYVTSPVGQRILTHYGFEKP